MAGGAWENDHDGHQVPVSAEAEQIRQEAHSKRLMLLPFTDGLIESYRADPELAVLADRHYSRQKVGSLQFVPPSRCLVLRDAQAAILFVWIWPKIERMDKQVGYNCTLFRNESERLSSEIILEAEDMAFAKWGANRMYTYVDPRKIKSSNPGYCFLKAGWRKAGVSKKGKIILEK